MTIEFLPLASRHGGGGGAIGMAMRAGGRAEALAAGHGAGGIRLLMRPHGLISGGGDDGAPGLPIAGTVVLYASVAGQGSSHAVGNGGGVGMALRARGREGAGGAVTLRMSMRGNQAGPARAYGFAVMQPPLVSAVGDLWFERVTERVLMGSTQSTQATLVMRELVTFLAQVRGAAEGNASAADVAAFGTRIGLVFRAMLAEGVVFSASTEITQSQIARILARLVIGGHVRTPSEALVALLDALVMQAAGDAARNGSLTDTAVFGAWTSAAYVAFARALERVLFGDQVTASQTLTAIVNERVLLAGVPATQAEVVAALRDAVGFMATITLDDGQYVAWVINARSGGLSRYTNYPFNSFACIGGRYYGAASDGIHRLEGADDNGQDIHWRLRTGLMDMGTRRLKRVPELFIGYTSTGTMLIRAIVIGEDGHKGVAIYRVNVRPAAAQREVRQKLGRGLESIDWDFELESVDGASIDLGAIEFRPAFLERRTRG